MIDWYDKDIRPGDLVIRNYQLRIHHCTYGLVLGREPNGYLSIMWGSKLEDMWDPGDLTLVSSLHLESKVDT